MLSRDAVIAKRLLKGKDFQTANEEFCITVEFQLDTPDKDIICKFSSTGIVSLRLVWMRLVPRFGWKWEAKKLGHNENVPTSRQGIILEANPDDGDPQFPLLWGPYIFLSSGFYKLTASVSVDPSVIQPIAFWEVFRSGKPIQSSIDMEIDPLQHGKLQIITRQFYLGAEYREVEFRIFVKQGQINVHWLRLEPPEGPIWERYYEIGGRDSFLGLPLSAEGRASPSDVGTNGRYRRFERGTIYFNNRTFKAWEVWGKIGNLYEKLGGTGGFGFPLGPVQYAQSLYETKGEYQLFEGNEAPDRAIFAYPSDRTHIVAIRGYTSSIYWDQKRGGSYSGPLGFPIKDGEYDWSSKEGNTFKRIDCEGGYITWDNKAGVHLNPKPRIDLEYPPRITLDDELTIVVTGELEGNPVCGAWCTVSFPDEFEVGSVKVEGGLGSQNLLVDWPGKESGGNYGTRSGYVLQHLRVEMFREEENWPDAPANYFKVRLRPTRPGKFRIYARMTAQDDFDPNVWGYDPYPNLPGVIRDQQDEAVHVHVVEVQDKLTPLQNDDNLQGSRKHFFISYNRADRAWAEWIAWQLESKGYLTVIQAWDFRPGTNFVLEMDQATQRAERTIAVLSPNYLNALYTHPEWSAAFRRDPKGEKGLLLPVRVQECEVPGLLGAINYIDLVGQREEAVARELLLAGVRQERNKPATPPSFPASLPEVPYFPGT